MPECSRGRRRTRHVGVVTGQSLTFGQAGAVQSLGLGVASQLDELPGPVMFGDGQVDPSLDLVR